MRRRFYDGTFKPLRAHQPRAWARAEGGAKVEGKDIRCLTLWRRLFFVTLLFGLSAGLSSAQSLVEVAKKEKERRSKLDKQGEARVVTDRELQTGGRLPESLPATTTTTEGAESGASSQQEGEEGEGEDETKTMEYWRTRVEGVKKKIADLEEKLQSPELNWGEGIRNDVNPIGQRNLSHRQDLESQLAQAKAELRAIQDEARRAGVPPGWVR
jgi:hypothetical protein